MLLSMATMTTLRETLDCNNKCIKEHQEPKQNQHNIANLPPQRLVRKRLHVEQWRENKQQRHTRKTTNKTNHNIQLIVPGIGHCSDCKINHYPDHILLDHPFLGSHILVAKDREAGMLHDADAWEKHQRCGEENGDNVEELDRVLAGSFTARGVGQVIEDDGLDVLAVGCVTEGSETDEENTDDGQYDGQCAGELFGVGHAAADRDHHANTLIREHGYSNSIKV